MFADVPKLLGIAEARAHRAAMLRLPHVAPLTDYVNRLRAAAAAGAEIPWFDPWDGGVEARVLCIQQAPGRKAIETGFVSRNNPDETARNMFEICREAGIDRKLTVLWNVVPWYVGTGKTVGTVTRGEVASGLERLPGLLELLPKVRTVVLLGRKAESAASHLTCAGYRVFLSPLPSPLFVNRARGNRERILSVFREVRDHLDVLDAPAPARGS
jgi:uracil-DNA glycosylase